MNNRPQNNSLILPCTYSMILVVLYGLNRMESTWMFYDRTSIINGELWRLLTSHMTHLNQNHLIMNIVGIIMVFSIFGPLYTNRIWLMGTFVCMLGISLGLIVGDPALNWYVGLSGVLHGLIIMGIIGAILNKWPFGYYFLLAIALKLTFEHLYGPSLITIKFIHSPVVTHAHVYGAITGLLFVLTYFKIQQKTSHKTS